jgi:hypothetical protein
MLISLNICLFLVKGIQKHLIQYKRRKLNIEHEKLVLENLIEVKYIKYLLIIKEKQKMLVMFGVIHLEIKL